MCDDQGDDGPFDVNCYHALARRERDDGRNIRGSLESDEVID